LKILYQKALPVKLAREQAKMTLILAHVFFKKDMQTLIYGSKMINFFTKKVSSALIQAGTNLVSMTTLVSAIAGGIAGGILSHVTTNADNREIQDMARGIKPIRISDVPLLERHIQNEDKTPGKRALEMPL
jgi:hypothetical protein